MHQPGSLSRHSLAHGASLSSSSNLAHGVLSRLPSRHSLAHGASLSSSSNLAHGVLLRSNPILGEPRIPRSSNLVVGEALLCSSQLADGALKPLVSRPADGLRLRSHSRRTPGATLRLTRHQPT